MCVETTRRRSYQSFERVLEEDERGRRVEGGQGVDARGGERRPFDRRLLKKKKLECTRESSGSERLEERYVRDTNEREKRREDKWLREEGGVAGGRGRAKSNKCGDDAKLNRAHRSARSRLECRPGMHFLQRVPLASVAKSKQIWRNGRGQ